jgi:hypothetical protein
LDYLATHTSLSPIRRGFAPGFANYKKWCTRLAVTSDKVYQLLAHGRWFSPGTPASSTTKTGRHDIAGILLKVALNTKNQIKSNQIKSFCYFTLNIFHCSKRQKDKTQVKQRRQSSPDITSYTIEHYNI